MNNSRKQPAKDTVPFAPLIPLHQFTARDIRQLDKLIALAHTGAKEAFDATIKRVDDKITCIGEDTNTYTIIGYYRVADPTDAAEGCFLWLLRSAKDSWLPEADVTICNAAGLVACLQHY